MSDERAGAAKDKPDPWDREWRRRSRSMGWAWTATIVGALLMGGSIIPSLANGQRVGGIVLGDAEIVPIFGWSFSSWGFWC